MPEENLTQAYRGKLALVTGGLGFMGSTLAHHLTRLGARVRVLDAKLDPYGWNESNLKGLQPYPEIMVGDIRDEAAVHRALAGVDFVFDCACQVSHLLSVRQPLTDVDINCRGALTMLDGLLKVAPQASAVYVGTRGVIGRMAYSPIDENHPTNPTDIYGIDKLAAEKYYLLYHHLYGLRTTSLRVANTYGPRSQMRHDDYGVVNWFIRMGIEGKEIAIFGDGRQTRDYNYVDDSVSALLLAAVTPAAAGEFFMLGSGHETPFIEILELIRAETGLTLPIRHREWDSQRKAIEIGNYVATFAKAERILGWRPTVELRDGIRRTIAFYRERRADYF